MNNHYDLNDLGPSWELMKQDMPEHRLKTAQDRIAENNLNELRAKLTSWPALFSKRYEVARALALGWWYQFRLDLVAVAIAILLVVVCGWLSVR